MVRVAAPHPEQTDGRLMLVVQWVVSSFVHPDRLPRLDREPQKGEYERIGFGQWKILEIQVFHTFAYSSGSDRVARGFL